MNNRLHILGVGVDPVRFQDAVATIDRMIQEGLPRQVVTVNPEFIMRARHDFQYRKLLNAADLAVPDGFGVRVAASYLNSSITWVPLVREVQAFSQGLWTSWQALTNRAYFREVPEIVTGTDLVPELAKLAAEKGYSVYLLDKSGGLAPDTPQQVAKRLQVIYPQLRVVGAETVDPSDRNIVRRIHKSRPDLLFVAFGYPLQEQFIAEHKLDLGATVSIGVGGALDYIAGNRPRPPQFVRGKFEWLWRLVIPSGHTFAEYRRRARRIFTAFPLFPFAVFLWKLRWGAGLHPVSALTLDFGGVTNKNGVEVILKRAWHIVPVIQWPALILFYFRFVPLLERGGINETEVWTRFLRHFGTKRDLASLRSQILDGFTANEPIWDIVRRTKGQQGIELALLTNNVREWMDLWERRFRLSLYFPTIVASCFVGKRKPNPEIFRLLLGKLGKSAHEVVFVDDHYRNVLQARRLGMKAIRCADPEWCARLLSEILPQ